jgi:hypothetical protein
MAKPLFMIRILVAISFFFSLFVTANGQSAQEIVAHHVEALGGKEKLQSLNSVYQEGTAVLPNGARLTLKIWRVYDRLYREEVDYGGGRIVLIVTTGKGWVSSPATGGAFKALPEAVLKAMQTQIDPAGALADYNAKGYKIERAGLDTVDGHPCYLVKVWFPSNQFITYSIDVKTWYILREVRNAGGIMEEACHSLGLNVVSNGILDIRFIDYRNTRGAYIFPFGLKVQRLGTMDFKKVEVNGTVDVEALSKPK